MKDYTTDKDGYRLINGIDFNSTIGVRVYVKVRDEMMTVFDFEAARKRASEPYGNKYRETFVSFPVENMVEEIEAAYARMDPKVAADRETMRAKMAHLFIQAELSPIHLREVPNQYCSRHCCFGRPWFKVTSRIGVVMIGWRKSVMAIDWADSDITEEAEKIFPVEDVTRTGHQIHAWSDEKAVEYLKRLAERHSRGATGRPAV